jgi:hypothetical protein
MASPNSEILDELARLRDALEELWQVFQDSDLDQDAVSGACCHVEAAVDELSSIVTLI